MNALFALHDKLFAFLLALGLRRLDVNRLASMGDSQGQRRRGQRLCDIVDGLLF